MASSIRVGVVGAGGRGGSFRQALHALGATVQAVCDIDPEKAEAAKELLQAARAFTDYDTMLKEGGCDAVVIGSPMPFHVAQSIAALDAGVHVLSEVTAGVTVPECKELVEAAARSSALYMMAENVNYDRANVFVNSLVESGKLGEVYAAEGTPHPHPHLTPPFSPWLSFAARGVPAQREGAGGAHALAPGVADGHPRPDLLHPRPRPHHAVVPGRSRCPRLLRGRGQPLHGRRGGTFRRRHGGDAGQDRAGPADQDPRRPHLQPTL